MDQSERNYFSSCWKYLSPKDPFRMQASKILSLLQARHREDVFVPEWSGGDHSYRRLDAWVMLRTGGEATTVGYEIKVSRPDFMNDDKWHNYLKLCHQFYFVCPHSLIQPEELPAEVGLIWVSKTGGKLFTKRKAARRPISIPESVYTHLIRWRIKLGPEQKQDKADFWREWLEARAETKQLGTGVKGKIKLLWKQLQQEVLDAKALVHTYETIRKRMTELGLDPDKPVDQWVIKARLREYELTVEDLRSQLKKVVLKIEDARTSLKLLSAKTSKTS